MTLRTERAETNGIVTIFWLNGSVEEMGSHEHSVAYADEYVLLLALKGVRLKQ